MSATKESLDGLKQSQPSFYIDSMLLETNPLAVVIPTTAVFFGSKVCNVIGVTSTCDSSGLTDQIAQLKATYSKFAWYESHFWIDKDAFAGDTAATEAILQQIGDELADFGCTYHGVLASAAIGALIPQLFSSFKEATK